MSFKPSRWSSGRSTTSFVARQVLGELAVALCRGVAAAFLLCFFSVVDDLLGLADRFFQSTDDFGRGFFAKIQQQLAVAIDASFALAAVELLQQLLDRQVQLGDFLVELVVIGFELQDGVSLFFDQLVFERQLGGLLLELGSYACRLAIAASQSTDGRLQCRWEVCFASMMATL